MKMPNLEGKMDTSSLATKRPPEIQFTIYQAIRLNGEKRMRKNKESNREGTSSEGGEG